MVNKVTLIGNLGADPEVRKLESGFHVAKMTIATSDKYKEKNSDEWITKTEWHNVVLWRNLAENAEKWYKKGMLIYVEGKLTHRKYTNKEGQERYITEVVGSVVRNLTPKDRQNTQITQAAVTTHSQPENNLSGREDLPF